MANITSQNPIRFTIDKLKTEAHALIIAKKGNVINCTQASAVTGFKFNYSQPAGTKIFLAFSTGDKVNNAQIYAPGEVHAIDEDANGAWFRLNSSGYAEIIDEQKITYESLIDEGNSISELAGLNNIPAFKGYNVRVAIALYSQDPQNAIPAINLALKIRNDTQTTQKIEYSPIYELGENTQLINVIAKTEISNNASITIEGSINESSTWKAINTLAGSEAQKLQLRAIMNAPQIGSSVAKLNEANIIFSEGTGIINGDGTSEIVSKTHNWFKPVKHCRIIVKHSPFKESSMKVYASVRNQPVKIYNESLGTGDGKIHTYQLAQKNRINFESVKLYFDGVQVFGNYEVNCEVGRITCTAPQGVLITCDYNYNWANEVWQELAKQSETIKDDYNESEYYIKFANSGCISAVKIAFNMKSGYVANESIGTGKGRDYTYKLAHHVKDGNITITANNVNLSKNNFYVLEDSQYVKIAAVNGQTLKASYDWISETPTVYNFHAVFSE